MSSAKEYNEKQLDSGLLTLDHITEMTKLWQEEHGISSDGYFGPKTAGTFEESVDNDGWRTNPIVTGKQCQ